MLPLLRCLLLSDRHGLQGLEDVLSLLLLLLLLPRRYAAGCSKLGDSQHWGPREEGRQGHADFPGKSSPPPPPPPPGPAGRISRCSFTPPLFCIRNVSVYLLGSYLPGPPSPCHLHIQQLLRLHHRQSCAIVSMSRVVDFYLM